MHNKLQTYASVPCFALDECHATALAPGSAEYFTASMGSITQMLHHTNNTHQKLAQRSASPPMLVSLQESETTHFGKQAQKH
jgi:hypothetical protein